MSMFNSLPGVIDFGGKDYNAGLLVGHLLNRKNQMGIEYIDKPTAPASGYFLMQGHICVIISDSIKAMARMSAHEQY